MNQVIDTAKKAKKVRLQMPNTSKGNSYAEAWRRVKNANQEGYYFETVTICESLISDRLLSFATGFSSNNKINVYSSFSDLIKKCKDIISKNIQHDTEKTKELLDEIDNWRRKRNEIIHGLAKSIPGTPTMEVSVFLENARTTAKTGEKLARKVLVWHKKTMSKPRTI